MMATAVSAMIWLAFTANCTSAYFFSISSFFCAFSVSRRSTSCAFPCAAAISASYLASIFAISAFCRAETAPENRLE